MGCSIRSRGRSGSRSSRKTPSSESGRRSVRSRQWSSTAARHSLRTQRDAARLRGERRWRTSRSMSSGSCPVMSMSIDMRKAGRRRVGGLGFCSLYLYLLTTRYIMMTTVYLTCRPSRTRLPVRVEHDCTQTWRVAVLRSVSSSIGTLFSFFFFRGVIISQIAKLTGRGLCKDANIEL